VTLILTCSKRDGDDSLAQRAIEAPKEVENKEESTIMTVTDHSYDPFPVTSDEWSGRNPFADDKLHDVRRLSPPQEEPDTTVKSRTPSPFVESSSPQSDTPNPSPQVSDQYSVDSHLNTMISPVSKYSVSSIESGYESSMSTPPNSIQMRNTNATSPVFYHETIPELVPANANNKTYYKQKPQQINHVQVNGQQLQNPFQSTQQYQTPSFNLPVNPTTDSLGGYVKQEPFTLRQCAGTKRSQSMQQSTLNNQPLQGFTRNANPILGAEMLMSTFDDSIPPIAPLKELKTEDLDILEIPGMPLNIPQMPKYTPLTQNMQYAPNAQQFGVPQNMFLGNRQANFTFNPLQQQQQLRNNMQPHFMYHTNQQ